jgi:catechol 2,3-dioxygenase-like lactoylglutathione lyase family enzyme
MLAACVARGSGEPSTDYPRRIEIEKRAKPLATSAIKTTGSPVDETRSRRAAGPPGVEGKGSDVMSNKWYSRPVLFVTDIDRSVDFYVKQLGFAQQWRFVVEGKAEVAQVARPGCEFILTAEPSDKTGKGLMFISLDTEVLDALRAELEGRGVDVKDGLWGYRVMVIVDPDGNEFYFPYEGLEAKGTLERF